uniref:FHF complex subunit HOOK-interacting protein C-terminal domain-containing protein n=1 Tax=Maylandia zebra TaxID=106582 RepID=A0A3P9B3U5_9CICH
MQVYSEDWHSLDQADWQQVPALVHFLHSLDFCSAVTKVAHPSIRSQLLGYIYNGFLVPVLAPALHKLTVEEVMTTTAYLDLFLRSISEPALLQTFLSFILLHTHDNVHILDTLVSRVNTPFQLGTVSLALFRTLIGLFCEDVMLQLVFRYLIPCSHLSRKQRCFLKQRDCYSSSAASFLLLMPSWFPLQLQNSLTHSEHIHWPKATGQYVMSDSVGYCRGSDFLMDVNYLHYLWDACQAISTARSDSISSSALELEWDDIFADTCTFPPAPPPLPPRHIQEMRRNATKLVRGSYVEESEFQDDVLVYDLIAKKDAKAAILDRIIHTPGAHQQHVHESMQSPSTCLVKNTLTNGHHGSESFDRPISPSLPDDNTNNNDFLSQYCELMLSLGVEPDYEDITEDIDTFRKRVQVLRQRLEEEEEELCTDFGFSSFGDDVGAEEEEEVMREEEEAEKIRSDTKKGGRRHQIPFTGPFISVLLSRLENLLENSIAVNLLVTGILAQLASYPQPLLRSFLLSTDTQNQPNVRTLYQVLVSLHAQIECYVMARPDYPALVTQAWRFLLAKDQDGKFRAKSQVFAIILYAEFLKELAALAQEHSIALDCYSEE